MAEKKHREFTLRKFVYNDKYLIFISIVAAIIIWVGTSMNLSPETTKTITVPVAINFDDTAADQLGLKCYGDETIDVEVTVSCKKYLARDISADNIDVSLQTNVVTTNGFIDVPIIVDTDSSDYTVQSYFPTTYHAYFDVEESRVMDINVNYSSTNYAKDGYVMGTPLLSETSVTLSGPKSYMSTVVDLVADVDIEGGLTATKTIDLDVKPIDAYGNTVDFIKVSGKADVISLTIPILKQTTLDVTASLTNKPTGLTDDITISYSVNKVNAGVLEEANIKSANIGTIDYSQLSVGENVFTFNVEKLESIVILDDISEITATVTVPDTYTTKTVNINSNNVTVSNVPTGYNYSLEGLSSTTLTLVGTEADLEKLSSSNISLVIDMSSVTTDNIKLGVNSYSAEAAIEGSNTCWVYGSYSVNVNLYE